jgi:hypothetical protein
MFADVRPGQLIDAVQTAALIVSMIAQIYTMRLLRNEFGQVARALNQVLGAQAPLVQGQGKLTETLQELRRRIEALERPNPPDQRPEPLPDG